MRSLVLALNTGYDLSTVFVGNSDSLLDLEKTRLFVSLYKNELFLNSLLVEKVLVIESCLLVVVVVDYLGEIIIINSQRGELLQVAQCLNQDNLSGFVVVKLLSALEPFQVLFVVVFDQDQDTHFAFANTQVLVRLSSYLIDLV